ncbi:MAG TPA: tetratricopeptide repeat protein, partial [Candidatus Polarisedimenticolia bacterium]|nr:tetratricopeptide repeat protein [Candidatus Polarisedimenticolia bacterium]
MTSLSRRIEIPALLVLLALACGGPAEKQASWNPKPAIPPGTDLEMLFHHNNLGVAHLERHHYQEAAKEFAKGVAALPGWADGHVNLGVALLNLHDNAGAKREFQKALEIAPRHPYAHYGLGLLNKQEGNSDAAMDEFRKVLEEDPEDPETQYNVGLLQAREGKHAEAVAAL